METLKDKKLMFLEMLEEALSQKIAKVKYLGKKSNFKLEDWEELFVRIRDRKSMLGEREKRTVSELIQFALSDITGIDLKTIILSAEGVNRDGKEEDFIFLKGKKENIMALVAFKMASDEDWHQVILGSIVFYEKLKNRIPDPAGVCIANSDVQ